MHGLRRWSLPLVGAALGLATSFLACNTPTGGGPGLEPPVGQDSSGSPFAGTGGSMLPTDTPTMPGAGGEGVPGVIDPDNGMQPAPPEVLDGGATTQDAGAPPDAGADAGAPGAVSCDRRSLACLTAEPTCPEGEFSEIVDGCFGACVPIDTCACDGPDACPDPDHYTCHMFKQRCGPYL